MTNKLLWLIALAVDLIISVLLDFNVIESFYSFIFAMVATICFYLSWIAEILLSFNNTDNRKW